ncbi:PPE family protein [Mycobacterium kubicae]|uniref:PPE family protein n=1 Tax=Mycobacterium kubicae TaxID=120959 RepID=UPI0016420C43|nr:PPE family protein [Mycobacterium kubicae]QNI08606.1 PPE family protein [Mycobacterium kubicae]
MVYGALPPEINSGRMYAGPGCGSLCAAAAAWDGLATDLANTAVCMDSVITGLISGPWLGATATMMATAATPYLAWLNATAAQAEHAASQAKAAVAAYETAYATTVHPALVTANRTRLTTLTATNWLGQNSPVIAATEMEYGEMWAQDATAMHGYLTASAAATRLTPFTAPPQTSIGDTVLPGWITDLDTVMSIFGTPFFVCTSSAGLMMSMLSTIKGLFPAAAALGSEIASSLGPAAADAFTFTGLGSAVSASMGEAASVGALSAPTAWAASAPTLSHAAVAALPGAVPAAPPSRGFGLPGLLGGMPLSGAASRAEAAGNAVQDGIEPLRVLPALIG